jgi:hypothetical protein
MERRVLTSHRSARVRKLNNLTFGNNTTSAAGGPRKCGENRRVITSDDLASGLKKRTEVLWRRITAQNRTEVDCTHKLDGAVLCCSCDRHSPLCFRENNRTATWSSECYHHMLQQNFILSDLRRKNNIFEDVSCQQNGAMESLLKT